jgi:hypothetical protein
MPVSIRIFPVQGAIVLRGEGHLLKESMTRLYRHSRMFVAGIYGFTGWIPA